MSNKIRVTLDPGHSSKYNRGVNGTYYESDRMYDLSLYLKSALEKYGIFEVYTTKHKLTEDPSLTQRGNTAISNGSRVFLSLHSNAAGVESAKYVIVYGSVKRQYNKEFAYAIGDAITKVLSSANVAGVYRHATWSKTLSGGSDYLGVIRSSVATEGVEYSILMENGFHTNMATCKALSDNTVLTKLADGIAKVVYDKMKKYYIDPSVKSYVGKVKTSVNIRTGAGTTFQKIGTLKAGQSIQIVSKNNGWYKFNWNGAAAYVSCDYVGVSTSIPDEKNVKFPLPNKNNSASTTPVINVKDIRKVYGVSTSTKTSGVVTAQTLNVRTSPEFSNNIIGQLKVGDHVDIYSCTKNCGNWYIIDFNGDCAFAYSEHIKLDLETYVKARVVANGGLNYRSSPGKDSNGKFYPKIGILSNGQIVYCKPSRTINWSTIKLSPSVNEVFYVASEYLEVEDNEPATTTGDIKITENKILTVSYGVTTTNGLNIRSGPGTSYAAIGKLTKDYYLIITGEANGFYKIKYNNKNAYCSKEYVNIIVREGFTKNAAVQAAEKTKIDMKSLSELTCKEWFLQTMQCRISSDYGYRKDPITGDLNSFHTGIDFAVAGGTPIYTPVDGVLVYNGYNGGYGNCAIIMSVDGAKHYFCHMKYLSTLIVGQVVLAGNQVGLVGTTGSSTGNHLHYEIRTTPYIYKTNNMNPIDYDYTGTINKRY